MLFEGFHLDKQCVASNLCWMMYADHDAWYYIVFALSFLALLFILSHLHLLLRCFESIIILLPLYRPASHHLITHFLMPSVYAFPPCYSHYLASRSQPSKSAKLSRRREQHNGAYRAADDWFVSMYIIIHPSSFLHGTSFWPYLHHHTHRHIAILEYLRDHGEAFSQSAAAFEQEAGLNGTKIPTASGMLEKKW